MCLILGSLYELAIHGVVDLLAFETKRNALGLLLPVEVHDVEDLKDICSSADAEDCKNPLHSRLVAWCILCIEQVRRNDVAHGTKKEILVSNNSPNKKGLQPTSLR
jgi:hypothetical protein